MTKGFFIGSPAHIPVIQLTIAWNDFVLQPVFVLDTGFSGDIKITARLANELGLEVYGYEKVSTASNPSENWAISLCEASLEGNKQSVDALIAEGYSLAGIGLLAKFGYKAVFDCKNQDVYIEKV